MARKKVTKPVDVATLPRSECFLLCDFARAENGKLDIVGGGWDNIAPQALPLVYPAFLAAKFVIPGAMAMESVSVRVALLDKNGRELSDPVIEGSLRGKPTFALEEFERSGLPEAPVLLAVGVQMQIAEPGECRVRLFVENEAIAETKFTVAEPPLVE